MAVKLFFGLPGCGKTTLIAYFCKKFTKKGSRYNHVYCNVGVDIPGVTYIDNELIGEYALTDGVLLIDEATLFADNRDYKSFSKDKIQYFLLHRHYKIDIFLFTQQWDAVDKKIRVITDRVYYVYKGPLLGKWFTSYYRIPYGIIIPDPNKKGGTSGEKLGEIVQGYCKPSFLVRLFSTKIFRPFYYKYFDSWEAPELKPIPSKYKPIKQPVHYGFKEKLKNKFIMFKTKLKNGFKSDLFQERKSELSSERKSELLSERKSELSSESKPYQVKF